MIANSGDVELFARDDLQGFEVQHQTQGQNSGGRFNSMSAPEAPRIALGSACEVALHHDFASTRTLRLALLFKILMNLFSILYAGNVCGISGLLLTR